MSVVLVRRNMGAVGVTPLRAYANPVCGVMVEVESAEDRGGLPFHVPAFMLRLVGSDLYGYLEFMRKVEGWDEDCERGFWNEYHRSQGRRGGGGKSSGVERKAAAGIPSVARARGGRSAPPNSGAGAP